MPLDVDPLERGVVLVPMGTSDLDSQAWLTLCEGARVGDRYVLIELVANTSDLGMYRARDERTGGEVLLRLQPRPALPDPRLRHPNILRFEDRGRVGAWYASILDRGQTRSLSQELLRSGRFTERAAVGVAVQLLDVLDAVHAQGLAHGGLSLERLLLDPEGYVFIEGFPEGFEPLSEGAMALAAPERWSGARADERSDIYAVGVLLHTLLTGRPPFGSGPGAREGHASRPLPQSVSPALFGVLHRATSKHPVSRHATAATLMQALLAVVPELGPATPTPGPARGSLLLDEPRPLHPIAPATFTPVAAPSAAKPASVRDVFGEGSTIDPAPPREFAEAAFLPAMVAITMALLAVGAASVLVLGATGLWVYSTRPVHTLIAPVDPGSLAAARAEGLAFAPVRMEQQRRDVRAPVTFGYDSYEARPGKGFDTFAADLDASPTTIRLTGHTDNVGSASSNELMGLGRAWSVGVLLAARGIGQERIELASKGELEPIAPNDTPEGRRENRRVMANYGEATIAGLLDAEAP